MTAQLPNANPENRLWLILLAVCLGCLLLASCAGTSGHRPLKPAASTGYHTRRIQRGISRYQAKYTYPRPARRSLFNRAITHENRTKGPGPN